ncbi:Inositol 1 [Nibea albiflora]|uniref:Inositol 1 n=1 Tax=Nibea albiflora TaxID=240163 RepID=A0ACB7FLZ3_NIBAL|nr:Inositol 1 [Nibea albiflora]
MQDTLLRVFVVALSLLTYPRDDSRVKEWDDITAVGVQKSEESLLRGEKLKHEMAPVSEEMTQVHTDKGGFGDEVKNIPMEQNQSDPLVAVKEDVTVTKHDSEEESADHKLPEGENVITNVESNAPQNSKSEPEKAPEKQKEDPRSPQGQQENPEKQGPSSKEQESSQSHLQTKTSENETSGKAIVDWEKDYLWYIWNAFSIISMIRWLRKYLGRHSQMEQEDIRASPVTCTTDKVPLPDSDTLQQFHSKYIKVTSDKKWRDFLEGFANDLLAAMRTVCDSNDGMVIEDFQMVDVYNIIVPFTPPDSYSFQYLLWNNQASDLLPDTQVCGQIKLVENKKIQNSCPCQAPGADDMVCLLHCDTEKVKTKMTVCDGLLCMKNSPFLSQSQVTRWFQSTIKQAWAQISHKYEFELNICYIYAPGALLIRFRSGKKISFSMNPVVKLNTGAHFFVTPCFPDNFDTFWSLSLTNYEDQLLEHIAKRLPENSCHIQTLEIALFLHKRQTALSGSNALKDFHFKTALMHLLLAKDPSEWKPKYVACRLQDLLVFMEKSLEKKLLNHTLIGNPLTQKLIKLPAEFTQAKTVNLFHPLVVHNCIYRNAVMHFQEMLRNTHMLIQDYVD